MALVSVIRKAWPKWILFFAFWTVLGLAFAGQLYLSRSKIGDPVTWAFALERALADWYVFALLSIPAVFVARRFPFVRAHWGSATVVHLIAGAIFSIAWMALRASIEHWQSRGELYPVSFGAAFGRALVATFVFNLLVYWGVVIVQQAFEYYAKFHEREVHTAELERRLTESRLQALQMQLNPHFLFNTLNAISSLMHKDVEAADRMIVQLSDLLRYALESTGEQEVPLRKELSFLDRYLEIQQARFGDRLEIQREIAPETLQACVPNLILQPLVENAIQHGIAPHARHGRIMLTARHVEGTLELEVRDNGNGPEPSSSPRTGVGVANTRARLEQLYGAGQSFDLVAASDGGRGTIARVKLPFRLHEEPAARDE
jgi:two-component system LytT family sensor kinase